jgi:hypothetical protein
MDEVDEELLNICFFWVIRRRKRQMIGQFENGDFVPPHSPLCRVADVQNALLLHSPSRRLAQLHCIRCEAVLSQKITEQCVQ